MASDISVEQTYDNPTAIFGKDYAELQSFYQYFLPPERLSPQSWKIDQVLTLVQMDEMYKRILNAVGMVDSDILYDAFLRNKIKDIQSMNLSDSTLTFDRRKGFSQIINATSTRTGEHKVVAISRRLRDSFAHGRIKDCGSDWILFEDKNKDITGRIVLRKDDLMTIKRAITTYLDEIQFVH